MANEFVARNGIIGLKDSQITGSLYVSSSVVAPRFTGSLFGTASWADNANTASFVTGSSVRGPYGQNSVISSSYAVTASYALNAGDVFPYSGSAVITGSLLITNLSGSGTRLVGATSGGLLVDYSGSIVSGAIGYIHSQSSAATTWNVTHGLNVESPVVTIYDSSKIVVIPNSITITGPNTLDVGFTAPLAGYASIVDPTSQYEAVVFQSALVYKHTQSTLSTTWTINHNLKSTAPIVTVYDGTSKVMIPQEISVVDQDNLTITFSSPESGSASIIGNLVYLSGSVTLSSSYALSASYAVSASYAISSSAAISASYALTASFIATASWAKNAVSSSYPFAISGSTIYTTALGSTTLFSTQESTFIGQQAGLSSSYAGNNNRWITAVGYQAASASSAAELSVSMGYRAGSNSYTYEAVSIGADAGYSSSFIQGGVNIGARAGSRSDIGYSVAIGNDAGGRIRINPSLFGAYYSIFIGYQAGYQSIQPGYGTIFMGRGAGQIASHVSDTVAIGTYAGYFAVSSSESNFIGVSSGDSSRGIQYANFIGSYSGYSAVSASLSNVLGYYAGYQISGSNHSILIGAGVGRRISGTGIGENNIIIGKNITLENGRRNSMNLGGIIFATGSYADDPAIYFVNPAFSGSAGGRVGINVINPTYTLDVSGSGNYTNGLTVTGSLLAPAITGSLQGTSSYALTASYLNPIETSYVVLTQVSRSLNYVDDTAAAAGGVPLGGLYRNGNFILIRIT